MSIEMSHKIIVISAEVIFPTGELCECTYFPYNIRGDSTKRLD